MSWVANEWVLPEADVGFPLLVRHPGGVLAIAAGQLMPDVRPTIAHNPVQLVRWHIRLLQHGASICDCCMGRLALVYTVVAGA